MKRPEKRQRAGRCPVRYNDRWSSAIASAATVKHTIDYPYGNPRSA